MKVRVILIAVIALIVGFSGGYLCYYLNPTIGSSVAKCHNTYQFIDSDLACITTPIIKKKEYTVFANDLTSYIDDETKKHHDEIVSVYFRDLNEGPTFGINEKITFIPASLLKLPLLITYYTIADQNPAYLQRTISFRNDNVTIPNQTEDKIIPKLEQNKPYAISALLSRMIIYSDNVSYYVLYDYLKEKYKDDPKHQTLVDFGLTDPSTPNQNTITSKSYASIFRQLYSSSYLSPQLSEDALALLSRSIYKKGLVAGVPDGITVAHKYGERTEMSTGDKQLHDCGIIYYPKNPYVLCIMTRGRDFVPLRTIIKTISQKVYEEVNARKN